MSRFAFCAALLGMLLCALPCSAQVEGSACGDLAILYTSQFGYGYSTYTMAWNTTLLAGTPVKHACCPSLGLLITTQRLYVFNALSGQWFSRSYSGTLRGFDIDGAVVVLWTDTACYAISSIWTIWATVSLLPGETVIGGGSCTTFGMIWTTQRALAYRANQNNFSAHDLDVPPLGGVAANGLGLVYTPSDVHVFEANPGEWIELDLEGSPAGLSATGCGEVALVWGDLNAWAYSGHLETWSSIETMILEGSAGGNMALAYNNRWAHAFDANTGAWSPIRVEESADGGLGGDEAGSSGTVVLLASPNPSAGGSLTLRLPADPGPTWNIDVLDPAGRRVRSLEAPASAQGTVIVWDWTDGDGQPLSAGTYWVRADSGTRTEARRVVRLP